MAKNYKTITLDPKYVPKKTEEYMSADQRAYFYHVLTDMRAETLNAITDTARDMTEASAAGGDEVRDEGDSAAAEQDAMFALRMHNRDKNLLTHIDAALDRLEKGTYGYSVVSGDEIGLKRLLAQPFATMTIEEREEYDRNKK